MPYDPAEIEPRWQAFWESRGTFKTPDASEKPKYYVLDMFPYPSGAGLHVGHPEGYTATDVVARWKRMQGFNVLHPMGWDAFGLPAERAAVREGIHPAIITKRNVDNFRRQIKRLGFSYDWDRELSTSDPSYYRWTQWTFLKLFDMGLAYQAEIPVNWCPALGTVLSNEEVKDGKYVETGDPVERRLMKQWMLRITSYAERLANDLEELDWPEPVKKMQREWVGRSEGAEVRFDVDGHPGTSFVAFTTRPDTLFGATFCVLAPEHPLVAKIAAASRRADVEAYVARAAKMSDRERGAADAKEFTGVFTGAHAVNPLSGAKLPIWIADYVLAAYGTGAIMSVPGHDARDHAFATKFALDIRCVVVPPGAKDPGAVALPFEEEGTSANSGPFSGLATAACKRAVIAALEAKGAGKATVTYKLRDWLFSRQRYWGEPFPLITLADGTVKPVPLDELPVELPQLADFKPTPDGQPPLARATGWVATKDRATGRPARRETNTMPQWAGSCWYYLRFIDPGNQRAPVDADKERYWMPVDLYVGGTEHAVLHLLYARFWHKVLHDAGVVSTKEPFKKLFNQGMILAWSYQDDAGRYYHPTDVEEREGKPFAKGSGAPLRAQVEKMSKSKLNVASPDDVVSEFGADAMRLYELFMGPLEAVKPWQTKDIEGVFRFLQRAWRLVHDEDDRPHPALGDAHPDEALRKATHKAIAKVTEDIEALRFNTAISAMMVLVNELTAARERPRWCVERLVLLLAPFAPHLGEELWRRLGHQDSLAYEPWPAFDAADLVEATITLPVSVNGKLKERIEVPRGADRVSVEKAVLANERVQRSLGGKPVRKVIYVEGRMVNLVV